MIKLVDKKKKTHKYPCGYSFLYLIFGPFYSLFRKRIVYSLIVFVVHFFLIPKTYMVQFYSLFKFEERVINILTYPHSNFDLVTWIIVYILPRILVAIFIDKHYLKVAVNQKDMLPASDVDLEKLVKIFPKFKNVPIDSSFIEKVTFIPNKVKATEKENRITPLDTSKENLIKKGEVKTNALKEKYLQQQLEILYSRYESGFISEEELIESKKRLLK